MADPGRHPRDPRDDHREPGGDFGRLLVDPAGDPAGLHAASARRAYERVGGGTDLYPDGQLGVDGDGDPPRPRLRVVEQSRRRLWHRGDGRSEERRVGKECVSTFRYRWWPDL